MDRIQGGSIYPYLFVQYSRELSPAYLFLGKTYLTVSKCIYFVSNVSKHIYFVFISSHIYFLQEKYNLALSGFDRLESVKGLSDISAYYQVVIYYKQKKYNQVIEYGQQKISSDSIKKTKHTPAAQR